MNSTPLIYLLEEDDDVLYRLWQACQNCRPDWLLYCFTNSLDLLEHLLEDFSTPSMLIISPGASCSAASVVQFIRTHLNLPAVVVLTNETYIGPEVEAVWRKPSDYGEACHLAYGLAGLLEQVKSGEKGITS